MQGATERWVTIPGLCKGSDEICCNIFRNEREFMRWAYSANRDYNMHETTGKVEEAVFAKTLQKVKLYRLTRITGPGSAG